MHRSKSSCADLPLFSLGKRNNATRNIAIVEAIIQTKSTRKFAKWYFPNN